ncbi:HotDog domain-containing protein [Thelephora terrestris]|uniref:HotDog domain-containing protein n=1 Tax=Thelephora terrestris TaxID=56493 RepID=A0A9P6H5B5_9AGAM|nr:HotDog domain-containing protein [Thelephora terrestris]
MGYDPDTFYEQKVVWGDHDSFQHVNNARYARYLESARIEWMMKLGNEIGGPGRAQAMVKGEGVSLILKSLLIKFKRPVTFPDTLLIAHKPYIPQSLSHPRFHFHCRATMYSYSQRAVVAESDSELVWYDYESLGKCDPGPDAWDVVLRYMRPHKDL